MKISTPKNFHFVATVESHGWRHLAPYRWSGRTLRRRESLPGGVVELEITHRSGALHVAGANDSPELRKRIARMFQLGVDTSEFVALTRNSPPHAWVEREGFGRLLCCSTLWEDAVKIIATTNTTWSQTVRMVDHLVQKCGREGAFPDPHDVGRFTVDELLRDCRLGYRAKSIHALASFDLSQVSDPSQTTEQRFKSYRTLPGIGPYGAAHLLAMDGRHDFIAVDTEFRRFVRDRYHKGRRVSDAAMVRRYSKWGRWKYLAYWAEMWGEDK